jgi:ribA/ribD-fused uncharacterized protein
VNYKFFWSGDDILSNFYLIDYYHAKLGHKLCCSEQDYMWEKAMYFGDVDLANKILMLKDPKHIKAAGQTVKGMDKDEWSKVKTSKMYDVVFRKFTATPELLLYLKNTGDDILVEASPYDRVWGIGYNEYDALKVPISDWGSNLLGQVLMNLRRYLGGR